MSVLSGSRRDFPLNAKRNIILIRTCLLLFAKMRLTNFLSQLVIHNYLRE